MIRDDMSDHSACPWMILLFRNGLGRDEDGRETGSEAIAFESQRYQDGLEDTGSCGRKSSIRDRPFALAWYNA